MDNSPPLFEVDNLLVSLLVTGHLLGGGGSILQHLELGLSVVLQVLAVTKDLTSLDKGDRLPKTFLLANLRVLHPWLKHLDSSLELGPEFDVLRELGTLHAGLVRQGIQGGAHLLQPLDELLRVAGDLLTALGELRLLVEVLLQLHRLGHPVLWAHLLWRTLDA